MDGWLNVSRLNQIFEQHFLSRSTNWSTKTCKRTNIWVLNRVVKSLILTGSSSLCRKLLRSYEIMLQMDTDTPTAKPTQVSGCIFTVKWGLNNLSGAQGGHKTFSCSQVGLCIAVLLRGNQTGQGTNSEVLSGTLSPKKIHILRNAHHFKAGVYLMANSSFIMPATVIQVGSLARYLIL